MANVGQIYELNMVVRDSDSDTSVLSLYLGVEGAGDEPGIEAMLDIATTMVGLIQPLILGHIESASMSIPLVVFDSGAPDSNSDVEEGAQFNFRADDTRKTKVLRIPTFRESKLDAGNVAVNLADTDVDAWVDAMLLGFDVSEGLDTITVRACDSEGRLLNAVKVAEEDFRDRRRRR